ncbi:hypothetical protein BHE74_00050876 [Ensete ventricosum]|nr:hypothetical protein BHE74_00050876 [Ensete ventricosum]
MIKSYWELHFGAQHNDNRAMDSRSEGHGTSKMGLPCMEDDDCNLGLSVVTTTRGGRGNSGVDEQRDAKNADFIPVDRNPKISIEEEERKGG